MPYCDRSPASVESLGLQRNSSPFLSSPRSRGDHCDSDRAASGRAEDPHGFTNCRTGGDDVVDHDHLSRAPRASSTQPKRPVQVARSGRRVEPGLVNRRPRIGERLLHRRVNPHPLQQVRRGASELIDHISTTCTFATTRRRNGNEHNWHTRRCKLADRRREQVSKWCGEAEAAMFLPVDQRRLKHPDIRSPCDGRHSPQDGRHRLRPCLEWFWADREPARPAQSHGRTTASRTPGTQKQVGC